MRNSQVKHRQLSQHYPPPSYLPLQHDRHAVNTAADNAAKAKSNNKNKQQVKYME